MMRDCDFYEIHLAEYVAGDLPDDRVNALEAHLATCGDCRAELAREHELRGVLAALPVAPCPGRVSERVLADIAPGPHVVPAPRPDRPWARMASAGLVAAALAVALLVPALRSGVTPPTTTGPASADPAYTQAEIDQAGRDVMAVLALTADLLDRGRDRTMSEIFGERLPGAVNGSLRPPRNTHAPDAHTPNSATGASDNGGQG